jgi:hypothetical protein
MLASNHYVHLIALDFSKAFDVTRHSTLFDKLACLPLPDFVFNWLLSYFSNRQHCTKYRSSLSSPLSINASVVQGSAIGPPLFTINSSDLTCIVPGNKFIKYADDTTLLVPACNTSSIQLELDNIDRWSRLNNQKLNASKCFELIISRKRSKCSFVPPPCLPTISRVHQLTLLGVEVDEHLTFSTHVDKLTSTGNQNLYALKTLKSAGLPPLSLDTVCRATLLSRLTYASPCWWGAISLTDRSRLQSVLNRATKWGVCTTIQGGIASVCETADQRLFSKILHNPLHPLWPLLPPPTSYTYSLRKRPHNLTLPLRDQFTNSNFIRRMLFA